MGPALIRVDDRLLHGQVTAGWAVALRSKLIVLCSDEVAGDEWLREIYASAAPTELRLEILDLKRAAERFEEFADESLAAIILFKTPAEAVALTDMGPRPDRVNVGGMHFEEGKRKLLPYVFVDDEDVAAFRRLMERGIAVEAQEVPGGKRHDLGAILG